MTKGLLLIRMYEGRGGGVGVEKHAPADSSEAILVLVLLFFFFSDVTLALTSGFIIDTDT